MTRKKTYFYLLMTALFVVMACKDKKQTTEVVAEEDMVQSPKISFENNSETKKLDVKINGELFTSYVYDGQTPKPILYPIITKSGTVVTRGFPYEPRPYERVDHPHHAGLWFNYGDVNGLDFWNNSYAIAEADKDKYGTIHHSEIIDLNENEGALTTKALWRSSNGTDLLEETTVFTFAEEGNTRYIDRSTTLKALEDVSFKDNKEGMLGIRVTRELELPSDKPAVFTDAQGIATTVEALNNEGVNGDYLGSEGATGNDAWGTRNKWMRLQGEINDEMVSVTMIDHEKNVGYPTYWHARGYGLFAANPLGQAIFSKGAQTLDYKLAKSESAVFKYRILIHNGTDLSKETIENASVDFNKK